MKSVINAPDVDRAVQTAVPMISAMIIPAVPLRPIMIMHPMASTTVMRVMPDTGLTPTMAMAWAATGVKRKLSRNPTIIPTRPNLRLAAKP